MGIKESIEKGVNNVKDTINEAGHRSAAEAEQSTRDLAGDEMTTGEKARSVANQAKETVQAEYDKTKRDIRNS